ncbi:MAG: hypothetical protein LM556_00765 [Desulfurococcaceae archaeon]|nr:hypothetical protein [Desulfurococcaceae archaeon]
MNTPETPLALRSLLGDISVSVEDLGQLEEATSRFMRDYDTLIELLRRTGLLDLVRIYDKIKNCAEHYSWVLNKAGKKYYYYYLKCKEQKPMTIYIGKTPEGYNAIKRAARAAIELKQVLDKLRGDLKELEVATKTFKENIEALGVTRSLKH